LTAHVQGRISVPALAIPNVEQDHECGAERRRRTQSFDQTPSVVIYYLWNVVTGHYDNCTSVKLLPANPIANVGILEGIAQPLGLLHANSTDDDVTSDHCGEERDPLRQPSLTPGRLQDNQTHWKDPERSETGSHPGLDEPVERAEEGYLHLAIFASRVVSLFYT
jgi:hypothetical protein